MSPTSGRKMPICPECEGSLRIEYDKDHWWCPYCSIKVLKEERPDSCSVCPYVIIGPLACDEDGYSLDYHEAECGLGECKWKEG